MKHETLKTGLMLPLSRPHFVAGAAVSRTGYMKADLTRNMNTQYAKEATLDLCQETPSETCTIQITRPSDFII